MWSLKLVFLHLLRCLSLFPWMVLIYTWGQWLKYLSFYCDEIHISHLSVAFSSFTVLCSCRTFTSPAEKPQTLFTQSFPNPPPLALLNLIFGACPGWGKHICLLKFECAPGQWLDSVIYPSLTVRGKICSDLPMKIELPILKHVLLHWLFFLIRWGVYPQSLRSGAYESSGGYSPLSITFCWKCWTRKPPGAHTTCNKVKAPCSEMQSDGQWFSFLFIWGWCSWTC